MLYLLQRNELKPMPTPDTTRRLTLRVLDKDLDAFNGLNAVTNYVVVHPKASPETLQQNYAKMVAMRQKETEMAALFKAAVSASRQAEWEFHNSVLSMKESVRAQFGPDSDEAQSVGYKKKSERKRPRRSTLD